MDPLAGNGTSPALVSGHYWSSTAGGYPPYLYVTPTSSSLSGQGNAAQTSKYSVRPVRTVRASTGKSLCYYKYRCATMQYKGKGKMFFEI